MAAAQAEVEAEAGRLDALGAELALQQAELERFRATRQELIQV